MRGERFKCARGTPDARRGPNAWGGVHMCETGSKCTGERPNARGGVQRGGEWFTCARGRGRKFWDRAVCVRARLRSFDVGAVRIRRHLFSVRDVHPRRRLFSERGIHVRWGEAGLRFCERAWSAVAPDCVQIACASFTPNGIFCFCLRGFHVRGAERGYEA